MMEQTCQSTVNRQTYYTLLKNHDYHIALLLNMAHDTFVKKNIVDLKSEKILWNDFFQSL